MCVFFNNSHFELEHALQPWLVSLIAPGRFLRTRLRIWSATLLPIRAIFRYLVLVHLVSLYLYLYLYCLPRHLRSSRIKSFISDRPGAAENSLSRPTSYSTGEYRRRSGHSTGAFDVGRDFLCRHGNERRCELKHHHSANSHEEPECPSLGLEC